LTANGNICDLLISRVDVYDGQTRINA